MKLYINMATKTVSALPPEDLQTKAEEGKVVPIGPCAGLPLEFAMRQIQAVDPSTAPDAVIVVEFIDPPANP